MFKGIEVMSVIRSVFSIFFYTINTLFWFVPIFICGIVKLIPIKGLQKLMSWTAKQCASIWVTFNTLNQTLLTPTKLNVTGLEELKLKDWYLVIANHQSWVDILVLQRVFNRKIPFLNFFLKKELIYVPVLGLCWWALDFPFMTRTSKSQLKKNPKLRGKDLETTRKACEKFKEMPVQRKPDHGAGRHQSGRFQETAPPASNRETSGGGSERPLEGPDHDKGHRKDKKISQCLQGRHGTAAGGGGYRCRT